MRQQNRFAFRLSMALVRLFAVLVPRRSRAEWRAEWESEFRHHQTRLGDEGGGSWRNGLDLVRRACGALPDAAWVRRQFSWDADVFHDLRHGLRILLKSPGFAFASIGILALSLGATVAVATLLDTLFLRPLPYTDSDRVVTLWQKPQGGAREDVAPANFLDWRERSRSFASLAAVVPYSYDYTDGDEPEVFFGAQVTEGFFEAIGSQVQLGRDFRPDDHRRGAAKVALISDGLWRRRFAADPAIVGRTLSMDGLPFLVVGVLPAEFRPQLLPRPGELAVWTPKIIQSYEQQIRDSAWWNVVGRLRSDVTLEEARSEMSAIASQLAQEHPRTNAAAGIEVLTLREHLMGDVRNSLLLMLGAVLIVLVIGCANVASLLLARGLQRDREFAIRAALGAGRGRLIRQLVLENLLLSGLAAVVGIGLAQWMVSGIVALAPAGVLRLHDAAIDGRMLLVTAALTIATGITFGLLPALQQSSRSRAAMRMRHATGPRDGTRRVLVIGEIALALVLLTCAGLLIRSFQRLLAVDPGFTAEDTVTLQVFANDRNPTGDTLRVFFRRAFEKLEQVPGVVSVGAVSAMPFALSNIDIKSSLEVPGAPRVDGGRKGVYVTVVSPGYFHTLKVPLKEGRLIESTDDANGRHVAVISESLRRREWPSESPVGKHISVDWQGKPLPLEIVGVVSQIRHEGLDSVPRPEVFVPLEQVPFGSMTFVVRGQGAPADLIDAGRKAIWQVDPLQTFYDTGSLEAMVSRSVVRQRFSTTLLSTFAALALVLSAIGLYTVVSFATSQRTREIGVRMALGAEQKTIRAMVLREGAVVTATGVAVGIAGSLLATRYVRTLLFEVPSIDPPTMAVVCTLLSAVAIAACYVPARRAMRVDPVVALRNE